MRPILWRTKDPMGGSHLFPRRPENEAIEAAWATDDGRATIHHGDCLDVMRGMDAGSVDAVVTDPPYEIGGQVVRRGGRSVETLPTWDRVDFSWTAEALRVLRPGGAVVAFTDTKRPGELWSAMESCGLRPRNLSHWVKANPPPALRRGFQSAVEVAVWAVKPGSDYEWNGGGATPNVYWSPIEPGAEDRHPTQKPVSAMRWILSLVTKSGATVLDPFLGSGTTGVAALAEGCRFVGIEREPSEPGAPDYVSIARARIAHAAAQGSLFA